MPPGKMKTSDLYDEQYFLLSCNGHDNFCGERGYTLPDRMVYALKLASPLPNEKVLDIGCGRGEWIDFLARNGVDSYGIDFSCAAVKISGLLKQQAREEGLDYSVVMGDSQFLPYPDNWFDKVTMFDIVEHLSKEVLEQTLREVNRVMKERAILIIHTMPNGNYYKWGYPIYRFFMRLLGNSLPQDPRMRSKLGETHINIQTPVLLRDELMKCGFINNKLMLRQIEGSYFKKILCGNWLLRTVLANDIFSISTK